MTEYYYTIIPQCLKQAIGFVESAADDTSSQSSVFVGKFVFLRLEFEIQYRVMRNENIKYSALQARIVCQK